MLLAPPALDELCVNTLRFLAVDMVQKAKSGKYDPHDPDWPNRDGFVLFAGHGCA